MYIIVDVNIEFCTQKHLTCLREKRDDFLLITIEFSFECVIMTVLIFINSVVYIIYFIMSCTGEDVSSSSVPL